MPEHDVPLDPYRRVIQAMREARNASRRRDWDTALAAFPQAREDLNRALYETIRDARADGITWVRIGRALNVAPQTAQERYETLRTKLENDPS